MYKALVSFSGLISMSRGETRDISDEKLAASLLKAGYIEPVEMVEVIKIESKETPKNKITKTTKTKKK